MRQISQTHTEDQTGISLWTLADIKKAQAKQRALEFGQEQEVAKTKKGSLMDVDDDDMAELEDIVAAGHSTISLVKVSDHSSRKGGLTNLA